MTYREYQNLPTPHPVQAAIVDTIACQSLARGFYELTAAERQQVMRLNEANGVAHLVGEKNGWAREGRRYNRRKR